MQKYMEYDLQLSPHTPSHLKKNSNWYQLVPQDIP